MYETYAINTNFRQLWNPVVGCTPTSPGCEHCSIRRFLELSSPTRFQPTWQQAHLNDPLTWRVPRRVYVANQSDLFHHRFTREQIDQVFEVMLNAGHHVYQILSRRSGRMASYVLNWLSRKNMKSVPDHIKIGVSVERDDYCWRVDDLRTIPAYRYVAAQPLLGPLPSLNLEGIRWLMTAGEFCRGGRPAHPDWFRELRDRCAENHVGFVLKTRGAWTWDKPKDFRGWNRWGVVNARGDFTPRGFVRNPSEEVRVYRVGSRKSGRELDGQEWAEAPDA